MYAPKDLTTITTLEELRDFVQDELAMISQEFQETNLLRLRPVHRAPNKPRDGMILYADGTDFNPGSGKGTYEYKSGAWVKLF